MEFDRVPDEVVGEEGHFLRREYFDFDFDFDFADQKLGCFVGLHLGAERTRPLLAQIFDSCFKWNETKWWK